MYQSHFFYKLDTLFIAIFSITVASLRALAHKIVPQSKMATSNDRREIVIIGTH